VACHLFPPGAAGGVAVTSADVARAERPSP